MHRVVQRLLHQPTVRVRQLAAEPGGDQYAALLRELFDLEVPQTSPVDAVPDVDPGRRSHRATGRRRPEERDDALRLGTRGSALAMAQSGQVAEALTAAHRPRRRAGRDRHRRRPLQRARWPQLGVGVFVSALRDALLAKEIDFAVHSYKDLPTAGRRRAAHRGGAAAGGPARRAGRPRRPHPGRAAARRPDRHRRAAPDRPAARPGPAAEVAPIRGNVDTRLRTGLGPTATSTRSSWPAPGWPASAGPTRSPRSLDPMLMLPAPAQGALAVECRADDPDLVELLAAARPRSRPAPRSPRSGRCWPPWRPGAARPVAALADRRRGPTDRRSTRDLPARGGDQPGRHASPSGCPAPERPPTRRRSARHSPPNSSTSAPTRSSARRTTPTRGPSNLGAQHDPHP